MSDILISSRDLKDKNKNPLPKKASEFSNYTFWYYTSASTANLILDNATIHLSNIAKMNDNDEKELHKEDGSFVHCLCLCNSNTEKIPMWYLYAGIAGDGVAIGLSPSVLIQLIRSIKKLKTEDGLELFIDQDFDIEYGWIFYRKPEGKSQVFYKRKWYSLKDPDEFSSENYFIKAYSWEYEKEFRIVIHNKTGKSYPKLILDISPIYKKLKLKLGPEKSQDKKDLLLQNQGFKKYLISKLECSNLGINMNLCDRNFDSFLNYIANSLDGNEENTDVKKMREKICETVGSKCIYAKKETK